MILLVDIGNTRVKWSQWVDGTHRNTGGFGYDRDDLEQQFARVWGDMPAPSRVVAANVAGDNLAQALNSSVQAQWGCAVTYAHAEAHAHGVTNAYAQPEKLGVDRWMALLAARRWVRGAVCLVDCGSAITADVMDADGVHCGGWIAPGLRAMQRALSQETQGVRVQAPSGTLSTQPAGNTRDAVARGAVLAAEGFAEHALNEAQRMLGMDVKGVVTGGDAPLLISLAPAPFYYEPHLVLYGLAVFAEGLA